MNTPNDGGPAFPIPRFHTWQDKVPGMSLRDWFAGQALAGLCANRDYVDESFPSIAEYAYHHADAMLKARNKEVAP
jgi:hypothetical protein